MKFPNEINEEIRTIEDENLMKFQLFFSYQCCCIFNVIITNDDWQYDDEREEK